MRERCWTVRPACASPSTPRPARSVIAACGVLLKLCARLSATATTTPVMSAGRTVVPSIATPCRRDRTDDELFEHGSIEISKLPEVQAGLAHLVLAKLGQQR